MKKLLTLSLVWFSIISCQKNPDFDLLIANGNLINLETQDITKSDIYINNDRIVTINAAKEADRSAKTIIDATDKFLIPGLWDNHVHFRGGEQLIKDNEWFLSQYIANGITVVRDAGGDLTPWVKKWQQEIEDGERVGPTIFTSGPKIDGLHPTWAGSLEVDGKESIDRALDSLEAIGVDFVKLYDSTISPAAYISTLQKAEERGMISSGHMPFTVTLDQTIDAGIDAVEHLYYILKGCSSMEAEITRGLQEGSLGFWDALPQLQNTYDRDVAYTTFSKLKNNSVFVVPTLHIGKTLSYLDEQDHNKDSYLSKLSDEFKETYKGRIKRFENSSQKARDDRKQLDQFFVKLAHELNKAGVSLLAGSDAGAYNSYVYPGPSLIGELKALVNAGLTPAEALQTATVNGAKFLNKETDYGTIEEKKMASILILEANPLHHINNIQRIHTLIHLGTVYPKKSLDSLKNSKQIQ